MKAGLEENRYDRAATKVFRKLAQLLPLDRSISLASALPLDPAEPCNDWHLCGIFGKPCTWCGGRNYCPSASQDGSDNGYWEACCNQPGGGRKMIKYIDCCKCAGVTILCQIGGCYFNSRQPSWCPNDPDKGQYYVCTWWDISGDC